MVRTMIGTVVKNGADKTATVAITRTRRHPLYRKRYQITKKYLVHDADNRCSIGDKVVLSETRPLSRRKHWLVTQIMTQGDKA